MITILAIIFTIFVIVSVHELGHFTFAKLFGVRVEKFSIGFPPVIFKKQIGETEYSIGATPLGGFVKMSGMIDENMDKNELTGEPHEFMSKNVIQKFFILSGGVMFNLIFAALMFTMLFMINGKSILPGTEIADVDSTRSAYKIGFRAGDKILKINENHVSNWEEINQEFLNNLGNEIVFHISRNNEPRNLVFTKELFEDKESENLGFIPKRSTRIGQVVPDSPAEKAGLMTDDSIIAVNGAPVSAWLVLTDSIRSHPEEDINVTVVRAGKEMIFTLTPKPVQIPQENGPTITIGQIGITWYQIHINYSLLQSAGLAVNEVQSQLMLQLKGLIWLVTGQKSAREMVGGPITIAKMAGQAASFGFLSLIGFISLLSIVLALINILPLPALDGGHIVVVFIEAAIRRPLPDRVKIVIQQVGMVLLLSIMLFAIFNDFTR